MILSRPKRSFALERDMRALEKVRRVTTILDSDTFRDQLERIVETQAQRGPTLQPQPKTRRERDVDEKYERIATATASPAPSRVLPTSRPIDDLLALDVMRIGAKERADRCKLACVCRLVDFFGWSRLVYNHVTIRCGDTLLTNPFGLLYGEVSAASANRVDFDGNVVEFGSTEYGVDANAFALNVAVHEARIDAKCVIHVQTSAGTAVSCMASGLLPTSQEAISLGRIAYHECKGPFTDFQEKRSLIADLRNSKVLIVRGAGLVTWGKTVEEAFSLMCSLVRACEIQVSLMGSGESNIRLPGYIPVDRRIEGLEWAALMRTLDDHGFNTGHDYNRQVDMTSSPPARKSPRKGILVNQGKHKRVEERNMWDFLESEAPTEKPQEDNTTLTSQWDFLDEEDSPPASPYPSQSPLDALAAKVADSTRSAAAFAAVSPQPETFHPISTTTITSPRRRSKRKNFRRNASSSSSRYSPIKTQNIHETAEEVANSTSDALTHLSQSKDAFRLAAAQAENSIDDLTASASSLSLSHSRFRSMSASDDFHYSHRPPSSSGISVASSSEDLAGSSFGGLFHRSAMNTARSFDTLSVSATGKLEKPISVEFVKHAAERVKKSTDAMASCLTSKILREGL